ncbi:hypothetical protein [Cytobacillus praedii]|uniref:Uncharacterized protein n=1 Tax=Cytobacillus praedii TaxID=1742358 RepID=A0A4V2NTJ6_9BACI|nr:hypothetical protein [Cytobacillus praedii]TCJ00446.1 hypothetical protein E0Y62_26815 [Cytobacillus praedii]
MIQKLIDKMGIGDYYFAVPKKSEYNTTGKTELHTLDSIEPVLTGDFTIFKALIKERILAKFYY